MFPSQLSALSTNTCVLLFYKPISLSPLLQVRDLFQSVKDRRVAREKVTAALDAKDAVKTDLQEAVGAVENVLRDWPNAVKDAVQVGQGDGADKAKDLLARVEREEALLSTMREALERGGAAGVVGVRGEADARGAAGVGAWVEIGVDVRAVVGVMAVVRHGGGRRAWPSGLPQTGPRPGA